MKTGQPRRRGTMQQLVVPSRRDHEPRFDKILPSAMKQLVDRGLFTPDGVDDLGRAQYKITPLGVKHLQSFK